MNTLNPLRREVVTLDQNRAPHRRKRFEDESQCELVLSVIYVLLKVRHDAESS
jgi:hypothetical protein